MAFTSVIVLVTVVYKQEKGRDDFESFMPTF